MHDNEANRARLMELERAMTELDPSTEAWWARVPERNALRDAIDHTWRDQHRLGTRPGFDRRLPWPSDVAGRMRVLRAYIEEYRGVRMTLTERRCARLEAVEAQTGPVGSALDGWIRIVDHVARDERDYGVVLRDAIGFEVVEGRWLTVLVQGEGDYAWAVALDVVGDDDPPVVGLHIEGSRRARRFVLDLDRPDGHHGGYRHITDFVHATLSHQHGFLGPHERLAQWHCPPGWAWRHWERVWEPMEIARFDPSTLPNESPQRKRVRAFFRAHGFTELDEAAMLEAQIGSSYAALMREYDAEFDARLEDEADYSLNELVEFLEQSEAG